MRKIKTRTLSPVKNKGEDVKSYGNIKTKDIESKCHTLISSGNHCLSACDLRLTTSKCFIPIAMESLKFQDVLERKQPKTQKRGVNLSNTRGALRKLHPEHSRREVNLSIMGCIQESSSRSLWAATTSILLKNGIRGIQGFCKISENLGLAYFT